MELGPAGRDDKDVIGVLSPWTFPELNRLLELPDDPAALAPVLVGEVSGRVVAAAMVAPLLDETRCRRVSVLAATARAWFGMYAAVQRRLRADGVRRAYVIVREDCGLVRARLDALGCRVQYRSWGANLELGDNAELEPYEALTRRVLDGGHRIDVVTPDQIDEAYRLYHRHRADFPSTPATEPDDYTLAEIGEFVRAGCIFGVFDEERLCAMTIVRRRSATHAETEITVTDRTLRGRGLATAVKAYTVLALWRTGVRQFATGGADVNEASLKANLRLGYVLEPLWLTYARVWTEAG